MSRRRLAIALLAASLAAAGLGAQVPYLETGVLQALEASGELRSSLSSGAAPRLLPLLPRRAQILEQVQALQLDVGVEILAVYPGTGAALDSPEAVLRLYNLMHAFSGMKGLEYYSASRRRMRTLFADSYTIDDPISRRRVSDRVFQGDIPVEDWRFLFQEDLTFGGTVYLAEFFFDEGVLSLHTSNLTAMRFLGIRLIRERESLSWICIVPFGGKILFYGLTGGKTISLLGPDKTGTREDSFYYRLKAIYGWYTRAVER